MSCRYAGLSHSSSAATVRISQICSTGGDALADLLQRVQGGDGLPGGEQVLGLQLVARARGELGLEVRQPLEPGAGLAELRGAVAGRLAGHRVPRGRGGRGGEPRLVRDGRGPVLGQALDPELGEAGSAPVGEHAHAVAAGHDRGEVVVQHVQRQAFVDPLADLEGRHHVQDQPGDRAEGAEVHHGTGEGVVAAAQLDDVAVGGDQLQAGHGGGQVLVSRARAVGAGRARAGHRDVRQRGQIPQREAVPVQPGGQAGVAQARGHPDQ